jgi:hypothetical protein
MMSGASIVAQRLAEGLAGQKHFVLVLTASDRAKRSRVYSPQNHPRPVVALL